MKKLWALSLVLGLMALTLLAGCAKQIPVGREATAQDATPLWQRYQALCAAQEVQRPYRVQMSLRYGTEGDTRRVTALLWGNNAAQLRLDVNAGVGATVAKIQDDGENFLVYAPMENKAYFHAGSQKPLIDVGVPMPFGVSALADLINGRYGAVFGTHSVGTAYLGAAGNVLYTIDQGRISGTLELNAEGLPVVWKDAKPQGWSLHLGYEDGATRPYKLEINHGKMHKRAVVLIKERVFPERPFTRQQLRLTLPEETPLLPLRQFKQT